MTSASGRTSRTFFASLPEQIFINSPMIMYHHEHHARPSLPYRALRAIAERSADPNVSGASALPVIGLTLRTLP